MNLRRFIISTAVSSVLCGALVSGSAQTWTAVKAPRQLWTSIASSANGNKWIAAAYRDGIYLSNLSTNSQSTWKLTSAPAEAWTAIASSADGTILAAAALAGPIYTSTNSGAQWTLTSAPETNSWVSIALSADGSRLTAVANGGGIYSSMDAGLTWTQTLAPMQQWSSVASSADGTHQIAAVDPGLIYTSSDSGATWTTNAAPLLSWIAVASSADGTQLAAAAVYGGLYTSTNSGAAWTQTSAPTTNAWSAIASSADGTKLVAAVRYGGIYTSRDSGATWAQANASLQAWSSVASSADGSNLVAVVYDGGIYTPQLASETSPGFPNATYQGLFYDTNGGVALESSGFFSAATATNGAFSAKLRLAGRSYSFTGQFSTNGIATNFVALSRFTPLAVLLTLDTNNNEVMTGQISNALWTAELTAYRPPALAYSKTNPAPRVPVKYTVIIPGAGDASLQPVGDGFGTLTADAYGNVTFKGTLGDGTPVSEKTIVSGFGQWPLYASLYSGKGLILGWLTFANKPGDDVNGLVIWIKQPQSKTAFYPAGFTNETEAVGSQYHQFTNHVAALDFSAGHLWLADGNLPENFTNHILLGTNNVATGTSTNKLKLTISASSGLFNGSVANPVNKKKRISFKGAVFQKQNFGSGYFLGTNQSGRVFFGP